ncbi:MAG TPA: hypothetical protein VGE36_21425, partial [Roseateles sp.]
MRRLAGFALIALAAALLGVGLLAGRADVAAFERLDHWTLDLQTLWRGPLQPGGELLLVRVDDAALEALGGRVPERAEI